MSASPDALENQPIRFPPYGALHAAHLKEISLTPVPHAFRIDGARPTQQQMEAWLDKLADEIAGFLWPRYANGGWLKPDPARMLALTRADLKMIRELRGEMAKGVDARVPPGVSHQQLFVEEDERPPGPAWRQYDPWVPSELLRRAQDCILDGGMAVSTISLQLKQRFQRPRPYQMAVMLNEAFDHLLAKSAVTPSLVSGHCLQACAAACQIYAVIGDSVDVVPDGARFLQQYLIDSGDRRVFAGVHYPSDNVSSWFCALRLCDHFYGSRAQAAKNFLWQGIQRSTVFQAMKRSGAGSVHEPGLAALAIEASRPVGAAVVAAATAGAAPEVAAA